MSLFNSKKCGATTDPDNCRYPTPHLVSFRKCARNPSVPVRPHNHLQRVAGRANATAAGTRKLDRLAIDIDVRQTYPDCEGYAMGRACQRDSDLQTGRSQTRRGTQ
jgi:hypothetical protein